MNGLSLQQDMKLQLKLSPAQIQVVRLLEVPAYELSSRINEELQANPALEEGKERETSENEENWEEEDNYTNPLQNEDFDYDNYVNDDETPDYMTRANNSSPDIESREVPMSAGQSFGEYLKSQVYLTKMDKPARHIAKFVVGNIDDDGYLRRSMDELIDDLAFREGIMVTEEQMSEIIREIQRFDPPGVGAKDLQECLMIQLQQKEQTPSVQLALQILEKAYDDFSHRHRERICHRLNITEEDFAEALQEITRLNPKPGSAWNGTIYERQQTTILPDFIVEVQDNDIRISLNQGDIPDLHVSGDYNEMLENLSKDKKQNSQQQREALQFVKQKIDAANWFIEALRQRNETLMQTMRAIVKTQKAFFLDGDETDLRPMVMQEIADMTGYDVSTISRVSNSKYVQTASGIYPLKFFFSEGMTNTKGEEVSTREVKKSLKELVASEDKKNPLTDDMLVRIMRAKGYQIARRTIAKYREQMGIATARLRREI